MQEKIHEVDCHPDRCGRAGDARCCCQDRAGFIGATRAVEIAEQAVGGQVLEVELDHRCNRTVYELELVKDDALHEVDIDARSGKVVARRTPVVQGY